MVNNSSSFKRYPSDRKKHLIKELSFLYGVDLTFLKQYVFYINSRGRIHITTVDLDQFKVERMNSVGLYFCALHDGERFRLSVEGSQLVQPKRNTVRLNEETFKKYITGENLFVEDIEINHEDNCPFLIVEYEGNFLGSMSRKDGILTNYIPKGRKLDYNKVF